MTSGEPFSGSFSMSRTIDPELAMLAATIVSKALRLGSTP
jgi:hypothetical protein